MAKKNVTPPKTFEDGLQELEQILGDIEGGTLGLEDSLGKYERGTFLIEHCRRVLTALGPHVKLEADWRDGYQEVAVFALDEAGRPEFWSFTSDGGRPHGTLGDGADVHPQAVAFIAPMPQGKARMLYWPAEGGGFNFAVEAQTPAGWSRFMHHLYEAEA